MQGRNMNNELPEGLLAALDAYQSDPDWFPPQGTAGLRAMARIGGDPNEADFTWIEKQETLHDEANDIWLEIARTAPMPTREDVTSTNKIVYPDWVGTIWAETLQLPWSQNFPEALEEAKVWLEQATTAKE